MVAVPIPDTYTVPQDYQPRRPDAFSTASMGYASDNASASRPAHDGPISFTAGAKPFATSHSGPTVAPSPENWSQYLAAGAFLAAGALLLTGHRRLGVAAAATGVASVLLEDREAVALLCQQLPDFLEDAQSLAGQLEQLFHDSFGAALSQRA